jgi:adenine-specific DNA-methyltransferase
VGSCPPGGRAATWGDGGKAAWPFRPGCPGGAPVCWVLRGPGGISAGAGGCSAPAGTGGGQGFCIRPARARAAVGVRWLCGHKGQQMSVLAARVSIVEATEGLIRRTEHRRIRVSQALEATRRADLGQFFTPSKAAGLIASMPRLPETGVLRILDPGAGVGSLTAALIARIVREAPGLDIDLLAVEVDSALATHLEETLADCRRVAAHEGVRLTTRVVLADLIAETTGFNGQVGPLASPFDLVIMNPPYRKLAARSTERQALQIGGVDCPNLYCAFLAVSVLTLNPGGQLVAITPRSFANGPYFSAFRRFLLAQTALDRLHVFESRSTIFADSDVLQENVVFSATRSGSRDLVMLSVSRGHADEAVTRSVVYSDIVCPDDFNQFVRIPADEGDARTAETFANLPCLLPDLDLRISTGKVVDFRAREFLRDMPAEGDVPLIYPGNLREGQVRWPISIRKDQALADCAETQKLMLPSERYVIVKRFSSKEERRRVVAAIYDPDKFPVGGVGFENHLNVFHQRGRGFHESLARGLCLWLNSSVLDKHFRTFSGHTQVNATDLRSIRYPSRGQLERLGEALGHGSWPDQEKIDSLVAVHILPREQSQ